MRCPKTNVVTLLAVLPLLTLALRDSRDTGVARIDRRKKLSNFDYNDMEHHGWGSNSCPPSFVCDGSGTDGYHLDIYGNGPPTGCPSSWLYFGISVGWQPSKSWTCEQNWSPPAFWESSCSAASWWTPPSDWHNPSYFPIPSIWKEHGWHSHLWPSKSWTCSGSGDDGKDYDCYGNSLPTGYPAGWKWFGVSIGWQPSASWSCPSSHWAPPTAWIPTCAKASWWVPSLDWIPPLSLSPPSHWSSHGWHNPRWPTASWSCSGSGKDGWEWDSNGNSCPGGLNWHWFGKGYGWLPYRGWIPSSDTWIPPSWFIPKIPSCIWWAPPDSWHLPHNVSPPPFWTGLGWDCGCEHTTTRSHSVSHTTSHSQSVSQKTSHSAPHSTTHRSTSHSHTTSPHSKSTTKKSTYTHKPTSIHTTAKKPKPTTSPNWHCNGSGTDGTDVDDHGEACPYGDIGFLWFGLGVGWQPPSNFQIPSRQWEPPRGWLPSLAPWWSPGAGVEWELPSGFGCPTWWSLGSLLGGFHFGGGGWL